MDKTKKTTRRNIPVVVGHRGAQGEVIGNTRAALAWAIEHGVSEIETDSRLTSDGIIVQHHDPYFFDPTDAKHSITAHTFADIKIADPEIMTLNEMIEFVNRRSRLMLEIKAETDPLPVIATVRYYLSHGWQTDDFSFASFDFDILKTVHQELPEIDRIVLEGWSALRAIWRARQLKTSYLSMNQQYLWWGFIRWAARHNHKVYSYPYPRTRLPFNHRKPEKWVKHGLHGIITDKPENYAR
ncbi:MAG: glycerophosphodiester phosphodiesterase [Candidatus Saccharimonadales bacterium]